MVDQKGRLLDTSGRNEALRPDWLLPRVSELTRFSLLGRQTLRLADLGELSVAPPPFTPGAEPFWDDPHIAMGMLEAHLDPHREAASRPHHTIDAEVAWLVERLGLHAGDAVLDLGCGPGLYALRFAERGLNVTGIDLSRSSIAHARAEARERGLSIEYRLGDYLTLDEHEAYRGIFLIYGDLCVLPDADRDALLARIHDALAPGGYFAFDVTTPATLDVQPARRTWSVENGGFWRSTRYLLLTERFVYPDDAISLDQYAVVEGDGRVTVYRNWLRHYTAETISDLLRGHGFAVEEIRSNLSGDPPVAGSHWLAVVAREGSD